MNINNFTNRIVEEAGRIADGVVFAHGKAMEELTNTENKVKQSVNDYLAVKDLLEKTNKEVDSKLESLKLEEKSISEKINTLNKLISDFNLKEEHRIELEQNISKLQEQLNVVTNSIDNKKNESSKLDAVISGQQEQLSGVISEINLKTEELNSLKEDIVKLNSNSVKELKKAQEDKDKLVAELEPMKSFLVTKQAELETKEKELNKKESGLAVIAERYKQLFGEKGLVFKV